MYHLGRILEIPGFQDLGQYEEMIRVVARASRVDRRDRENITEQQLEFARGEGGNVPSKAGIESMKWMLQMRIWFKGNIIRRQVGSLDYKKESIMNIKPYVEQKLYLKMSDREAKDIQETLEIMKSAPEYTRGDGQVSNFVFKLFIWSMLLGSRVIITAEELSSR